MKYLLVTPIRATLLGQKQAAAIRWRNGVLITDEPEKPRSNDLGTDPYTLLLASPVTFLPVTLRMYIEHKDLTVTEMEVRAKTNCSSTRSRKSIELVAVRR